MKKIVTVLFFLCLLSTDSVYAGWKRSGVAIAAKDEHRPLPKHFLVYNTDEPTLKSQLFDLPTDPSNGQIIELPLPDGTFMNFKVWATPVMPDALAAKYPDIKTFTGVAANNKNITAKLDYTIYGFHAMIFNGADVSLIDPADEAHSGNYLVHYKRDEQRSPDDIGSKCMVPGTLNNTLPKSTSAQARSSADRTSNGYVLRTYRLALACSHQYAQAATGTDNPTMAQVLSKMTTSLSRVNGVYERELSITMYLVANEDTLIWPVDSGSVNGPDPYAAIDSDAGLCLGANQTVCDARIGNANYDIGHVFTSGAGGLSQVGVTCVTGQKAMSVTGQPYPVGDGFDIDYVSHEMGHEYGADHPFNDGVSGSCGNGNLFAPMAYEPGSGSTIMAYAGICPPDDLQPHSDPYFHSASLQQMQSYITTTGDACAVKTPTNNKLVALPPFTASYSIPYHTPFELTAPAATDSVNDSDITYCWEQMNLGDVGQTLLNTHYSGPIFRSYLPTLSPTRIFPENSMVLAGVLSNAGTEGAQGEKAPDVARYLTFGLTLRDIYQGTGCFLVPDDTIHLDVIQTDTGFYVTSQNQPDLVYMGNSSQQVTWHAAGTNAAPINTSNVNIYLSEDGGNTWPILLGNFSNNGAATVKLPNPDSTVSMGRFKIKGSGNVFFNVNRNDFTITETTAADSAILLYPVPAQTSVRLSAGSKGLLHVSIFNAIGQQVWKEDVNGEINIPISTWARGIYVLRAIDTKNQRTIKKFVVD